MKKQKTSLAGPFSHLFETLHGDALLQHTESQKVDVPKNAQDLSKKEAPKTAVKSPE